MRRFLKLLPLLILFGVGIVSAVSLPKAATATPNAAPSISAAFAPLGGVITVTSSYTDDTIGGSPGATLAMTNPIGIFVSASLSPLADEVVTVTGTTVTVAGDLDTIPELKTLTATFQCTLTGSTFFTLSNGGVTSPPSIALTCGGYGIYSPPYYGVYPPPPGTYYAIGQMDVAAQPGSVACAGASNIIATVQDITGRPAPNGTSVTFTTNLGTISPRTVTTVGGSASAVFAAPSISGVATITASSSTMSDYVTVQVTCPPVPVAPPAQVIPAAPAQGFIVPPNTGDAGLRSLEIGLLAAS